jgi:hypothetical protein
MSHREIVRRALEQRLAQYEGESAEKLMAGREWLLDDLTAFVLRMAMNGCRPEVIHIEAPEPAHA